MKSEQFVFGKNLSQAKKEEVTGGINEIKKDAKNRVEGEYEKTPEELKFIELINRYIEEEFQELGMTDYSKLSADQFHFVSGGAYDRLGANDGFVAFVAPMKSAAYINKDIARHRLQLYKTILHEAIHLCSTEKNQVIKKGEGNIISNYRTGYGVKTDLVDKYGNEHEHFRELNEGVTDLIVIDILAKHSKELLASLKIERAEEELPVNFQKYRLLVAGIINKIAKRQNKEYADIWRNFKRGAFTGEMMHLRDVERTFGKGSLRVLAAASYGATNGKNSEETDNKIYRFFETNDEAERTKIAYEILNEREKTAFQKRRS